MGDSRIAGKEICITLTTEGELAQQMRDLAERLRAVLPAQGVSLGFAGPLGAGKTTAVRHLVAALGSTDPVASPTYILAHEYRAGLTGSSASILVEHWDLYRLPTGTPEELELPPARGTLRCIEWFERAPDLRCDLILTLDFADDTGSGESSTARRFHLLDLGRSRQDTDIA